MKKMLEVKNLKKTYKTKGGKETKITRKYKDSIDEFMGA